MAERGQLAYQPEWPIKLTRVSEVPVRDDANQPSEKAAGRIGHGRQATSVSKPRFWRPHALHPAFLGLLAALFISIASVLFFESVAWQQDATGDTNAPSPPVYARDHAVIERQANFSLTSATATNTRTVTSSSQPAQSTMPAGCEAGMVSPCSYYNQTSSHLLLCEQATNGTWGCIDDATGNITICQSEATAPICRLLLTPPPTAPNPDHFTSFTTFPLHSYFEAVYLPTLVGVLLSILWDCVGAAITHMEPFYRLARPQGAIFSESLFIKHNTSGPVIWYTLAGLVLKVAVALSSEVLFISTSGDCSAESGGSNCIPGLMFRPVLAIVEGAMLLCVVVAALAFLIFYFNRPSGVFANPTSLAGLGSLVQDPTLLNHISQQLELSLFRNSHAQEQKYRIKCSWMGTEIQYGLEPISGSGQAEATTLLATNRSRSAMQYTNRRQHVSTPWYVWPAFIGVAWLLLAALTVMIVYYYFVGTPSGFETFFDGQSIGPRVLMTGVGICIKVYWTYVDEYVRTTEPYRCMARRPATAQESILVESCSSPLTAIWHTVRCGHLFAASIAAVALFAEALTVTLAGVPFASSQSYRAYQVSTWLSVGILVLMLVQLLAVGVHLRPTANLRVPRTLGAKLLSLRHDEPLQAHLRSLVGFNGRERADYVREWRANYRWLGESGEEGVYATFPHPWR